MVGILISRRGFCLFVKEKPILGKQKCCSLISFNKIGHATFPAMADISAGATQGVDKFYLIIPSLK